VDDMGMTETTVAVLDSTHFAITTEVKGLLPYGDASISCPSVEYVLGSGGMVTFPELADASTCAGALGGLLLAFTGKTKDDLKVVYNSASDTISGQLAGSTPIIFVQIGAAPAEITCKVGKTNVRGVKVDPKCDGKTADNCQSLIGCAPDFVFGAARVSCPAKDADFQFFGCNNRPESCLDGDSWCDTDSDCCSGWCDSKKMGKDGTLASSCRPMKVKPNAKHIAIGAAGGLVLGAGVTTAFLMRRRRRAPAGKNLQSAADMGTEAKDDTMPNQTTASV